jgi:hypothetical protein
MSSSLNAILAKENAGKTNLIQYRLKVIYKFQAKAKRPS